ncbi:MAG: CPBP family intramembrane metalloprotease [Candidatus Heimdallarchaeota archaeon]|nr:CPBP family intramembrane metalloprotease [Candidatus Heimdallarchaeota archaeon]MCK5048784.1 CPBP family intramembrane metalloprotease [Candidatus Heimdallarchaeota archaeon]
MTNEFSSVMSTSIRYRLGNLLIENKFLLFLELVLLALILILKTSFLSIIPVVFLGWMSLRLRWISWRDIGFNLQFDWVFTLFLGVGVGCLLFIGDSVIYPYLIKEFRGYNPNKNIVGNFDHSISQLFIQLAIAWFLIAVAEELFFRGFLINRLNNTVKNQKISLIVGIFISLSIYLLVYYFQERGDMGMGFIISAVLTWAYIYNKKHLGLTIIISGIYNSLTVLSQYYSL